MPRKPTWGTPTRSQRYPPLRRKWGLLIPSAMVAGAAALLLVGAHTFGARTVLSPGSLSAGHADFASGCEQCHSSGQGVPNVRCQRCHDPSAGGRLTHAAHVLFGSGDPRKAAAAADVACAQCHVEHGGRRNRLDQVEDVQCAQCHFGSLHRHPEFSVLSASTAEAPGLKFGHQKHIEEVMKQEGMATAAQTCGQCHARDEARRDFEPVSFDHCVACHARTGSVGSADPVPLTDVVDLEGWRAAGAPEAESFGGEEFEISRGKVARPSLRHRDPWVLFNLASLRAQTDPDALTAERARLEGRIAALDRRLATATPFAALGRDALEQRATEIERESQGAAGRLAAMAKAGDASSAAARLDEIEKSLRAAGEAPAADEVATLGRSAAAAGAGPAPLSSAEFQARRQEVLSLLEAVEASDPALKARTEDLRRRLVALQSGEDPADLLARVRDQRQATLARLRDELKLRAQGVAPPRVSLLDAERRALEAALTDARAQLAGLSAVPAPGGALADDERQRKRETAEVLAAACLKCHFLKSGRVEPVRAARPVLVRAAFVHEPHLKAATCARCHPGIEASKLSQELNFKGIQSCRECHRPFRASQDCRGCHLFHPKAVP